MMLIFLIYDGSFPMDVATRILEKHALRADVGLYLQRRQGLDEAGNPIGPILGPEQVRQSFSLAHLAVVQDNEIAKMRDASAGPSLSQPLAQAISHILASGEKTCELVYFIPPSINSFYLMSTLPRLVSMFAMDANNTIAFSVQTEAGILSEGLLDLMPTPGFQAIMTDPDSVSLIIFFDHLARLVAHDWNVKDYPLTISKVSTIIQSILPPIRGKHRGFQGTYQRLCDQAELLVEQGVLVRIPKDNQTFYTLSGFGRVVSQIIQDPGVLRFADESVRELFLDKEDRLNVDSLRQLLRRAVTLGWIKP